MLRALYSCLMGLLGWTVFAAEREEPLFDTYEGISGAEVYRLLGFKAGPVDVDFISYEEKLKGAGAQFKMLPIRKGTFRMGSPANEVGRKADEGPQCVVAVDAFWMAETETTWNIFDEWLFWHGGGSRMPDKSKLTKATVADAISGPSVPYTDGSFGMGRDGFPTICMTYVSAKTFCMWLSAKTGKFYRLPTEAEWEYACRAGSSTAHYCGKAAGDIHQYAWFASNSDWQYQRVGKKKPNGWGLHDMLGNVWEFCLDVYDPKGYQAYVGDPIELNPLKPPTTLFPTVLRGGSWDDPHTLSRCAARLASDPDWSLQDPQLPKSIWHHTNALTVGFRVVRPREIPPVEQIHLYWPEPGKPTKP